MGAAAELRKGYAEHNPLARKVKSKRRRGVVKAASVAR
jgi:hypothetical protein